MFSPANNKIKKKISPIILSVKKPIAVVGIGRVKEMLSGQVREAGTDVGFLESTVNLAGRGPPLCGSPGREDLREGTVLRTTGPLPAQLGLGAQRWTFCGTETWYCFLLG